MTAESFATRLKKVKLRTKGDIENFVEKTNFDDKLNNLNKKVTSSKAKHVETDLTKKVEQIS